MLALAPETVHMERAVANYPPPFPIKLLSPDGRPACAWTARDFGPSGVIGDPTTATREQGLEILETLSDSWVQALTELHALRWVVREEATWGRGATHQGFMPSRLPGWPQAVRSAEATAIRSASAAPPFLPPSNTPHPKGPPHAQPARSFRLAALAAAALALAGRHAQPQAAGQVHLHDQLVRAGRARRLLPGGRRRASTRSTAWT